MQNISLASFTLKAECQEKKPKNTIVLARKLENNRQPEMNRVLSRIRSFVLQRRETLCHW